MKNDAMLHKKTAILLILEILKKYTDDTCDSDGNPLHCLTQAQIREKLKSDYDLVLDRKAVSRNLNDLLISYEDKIEYDEVPRSFNSDDPDDGNIKTNFRYAHDFDPGQIRMLINAVLFSNSLSKWECEQLIDKISRLGGLEQRNRKQKYLYNLGLYSEDKVSNESLLTNLDVLDEAIDKGRQVAYIYNNYGKDKKLHPKLVDGEPMVRVVNPYHMVANNGRFYLMCNYDEYDNATNVRIDKITDIEILDTPRKPKKNVNGLKDEPSTIAEQLYMQPGKPERIVFRASNNENTISTVVDWFGQSVKFRDEDEKSIICEVKTNPSAMRFWAMQYSDYVEILEPESLREEIRISLRESWRKYNDGKDTLIEPEENIKKIIADWKQVCKGVSSRKEEKRISPDVKQLGVLVKRTYLVLLPLCSKEITGQYSELVLALNRCRRSTCTQLLSEANSISLILGALLRNVDLSEQSRERRNIPDNVLPIRIHTDEDGFIKLNMDLSNFEEDYINLLHYTDKNAEEIRKMHDEIREKMRERMKESSSVNCEDYPENIRTYPGYKGKTKPDK